MDAPELLTLTRRWQVPVLEEAGYEADDLIASLVNPPRRRLDHPPQYSPVYGGVEREGRVEPVVSLSPLSLASLSLSPEPQPQRYEADDLIASLVNPNPFRELQRARARERESEREGRPSTNSGCGRGGGMQSA